MLGTLFASWTGMLSYNGLVHTPNLPASYHSLSSAMTLYFTPLIFPEQSLTPCAVPSNPLLHLTC